MSGASAIYAGRVTHRRFRPREHLLRYRVFWLLLDLDDIDRLEARLRLFSRNRFNLFSFYDADHGTDASGNLRSCVEQRLADAGIDLGGGTIRLFAMPRVLGYVFNPLSVYFCHRPDGSLGALVYQVHNTFGERHNYVIPVAARTPVPIRQSCGKSFYVSPFMDMAMTYDFAVIPPDQRIAVSVNGSDRDGLLIAASLTGRRREIGDGALLGLLFSHPLVTFKVMAGIHWEALRIWLKGIRLRPRMPAADRPGVR